MARTVSEDRYLRFRRGILSAYTPPATWERAVADVGGIDGVVAPSGDLPNTIILTAGTTITQFQEALDDCPTDGTLTRIALPNVTIDMGNTTIVQPAGASIEVFGTGANSGFVHLGNMNNNQFGTSVCWWIGRDWTVPDTTSMTQHCSFHHFKIGADRAQMAAGTRANIFELRDGTNDIWFHDLDFYGVTATCVIGRASTNEMTNIYFVYNDVNEVWEQVVEMWNGINWVCTNNTIYASGSGNPNLPSTKPLCFLFDSEAQFSGWPDIDGAVIAYNQIDLRGMTGGAANVTAGVMFAFPGTGDWAQRNVSVYGNKIQGAGCGIFVNGITARTLDNAYFTNLYASINMTQGSTAAGGLLDYAGTISPNWTPGAHPLTGFNVTQAVLGGNHNNDVTDFVAASSAYASAASNSEFSGGGGSWSAFMMFKADDIGLTNGDQMCLASKWAVSGNQRSWSMLWQAADATSGYPVFNISGDGTAVTSINSGGAQMSVGAWIGIFWGYDADADLAWYRQMNANEADYLYDRNTASHTTGTFSSTAVMHVGREDGAKYFDGKMCRFHFWMRNLLDAEMTKIINSGYGRSFVGLYENCNPTSLYIARNTISDSVVNDMTVWAGSSSYDTKVMVIDNDLQSAHTPINTTFIGEVGLIRVRN